MDEKEELAGEEARAPDPADLTLGGYLEEHSRPPAFEGVDGQPYTVSAEAEQTPDLRAPYEGYLVFPRWAVTGLGVVGHVETGTLERGPSREAVLAALRRLPLRRVKEMLDLAIVEASAAREEDAR